MAKTPKPMSRMDQLIRERAGRRGGTMPVRRNRYSEIDAALRAARADSILDLDEFLDPTSEGGDK